MTKGARHSFNMIYLAICVLVFVVIVLRAFLIPFTHDEASTFFFYVQNGNYLPYKAHLYTNNHVLNSALTHISYRIAGSHPFVLRLPNIMAFVVLCLGVFNFFKHLSRTSSKIILVTFFILTFSFLDFFELCRGYGLSMAFLVLGLSYLHDYFNDSKIKTLFLFSVCLQLALSANLTLVMVSLFLLFFIVLFQFKRKLFFDRRNLMLIVLNAAILFFWIKFSFYYKSKGLLDSGWGNDYWDVTFKSLMSLLFGTEALWIQISIVILFSVAFLFGLYTFLVAFSLNVIYKKQVFYVVMLSGLIAAFFLQKKLLDVNYPTDRTGLFLYVFFALSIVFFFESIGRIPASFFAFSFSTVSLFYFYRSFELHNFSHFFYHTIPNNFFESLEKEYEKDKRFFTLSGNLNREMNYAFANYRAGSPFNTMDISDQMHMNCDYAIALMGERPFYHSFYDELAYDVRWHRVLLKRRQPIKRLEIPDLSAPQKTYSGSDEFFEFLRFNDSVLTTRNCIEADLELSFLKVPNPFKAFLVLQVNDTEGNSSYYKKVPLNWLADDLSGSTKRFKLTTGPLPEKFKEVIVYLWNIDKKQSEFKLNRLTIFDLNAPGINVVIPATFYPYAKKTLKEELL